MLTIAGSDSGGGAGIQADIKTASACGVYAMSVITSVTSQNTKGVTAVHVLPADSVRTQAEAVLSDIGADAIKLGMLPSAGIVDVVAEMIEKYKVKNVVLDPVMIATSGDTLVPEEAIEHIIDRIFPLARVVTPNIPEAEFITGLDITEETEGCYIPVAEALFRKGVKGVLIKSGHIDNVHANDYLFDGSVSDLYKYPYEKTDTPNTHGTGCTLSSAIASFLALGYELPEAVRKAEDYIHKAIIAGAVYKIGEGHGPVHHFFDFWK